MQKIPEKQYPFVLQLIKEKGLDLFPLVRAVISGHQQGTVFTDNSENPSLVFIITKFGFSQICMLCNHHTLDELTHFLYESPEIPFYFHIYDFTESMVSLLEQKGLGLKIRERQQLRFAESAPIQLNIPNNYKILDIQYIDFDKLSIFNLDLGNRFWKSKDDFIKNAYGMCITDENKNPVSICYSACIVDGISEIDVATLSAFQGKGLAKLTVQSFVNQSIEKNIKANWDCFSENIPSLKTATSVGFSMIKKYSFLSVFNKQKQ